jgi:HlyD family secretion protein
MTANVTITTATRDDALRIPTSALRFRPPPASGAEGTAAAAPPGHETGPRVWLLADDGQARPVPVTTGIADDRFTEVVNGLSAGDRVITALHRDAVPAPSGAAPSFAPGARRGMRAH